MDGSPKGRILRAAAHLFRARGYDATTVRDLALAVGILSGSLFHHFRSKQEILEAVMAEVIDLNTTRMRAALAEAKTPRDALRALIRCELLSIHGDTGEAMSLLFVEWRSLEPAAQERLLALRDRYEKMWLAAIRKAKPDVVSMEPFVLRRFLGGAIAHTAVWYRKGGPIDLDALTDRMTALVTR